MQPQLMIVNHLPKMTLCNNAWQVFDIMDGGPEPAIELFRKVAGARLLACGGDGTVGWLLKVRMLLCSDI